MFNYCDSCQKVTQCDNESIIHSYPVLHESITINAEVQRCSVCHRIIEDSYLDEKNIVAAFDSYRKTHDLLFPSEIATMQEQMKMTIQQFADFLGVSRVELKLCKEGSIQKPELESKLRKLQLYLASK